MSVRLGDTKIRATIDFADAIKLSEGTERSGYESYANFYINKSFYQVGDEYRFITFNPNEGQRIFYISSVKTNSYIKKLISFFSTPTSLSDTIHYLGFYAERPDFRLKQLLKQQILLSTSAPNITGVNYFSRMEKNFAGLHSDISRINSLDCLKEFKKRHSSNYRLNILSKRNTEIESGIDAKYQTYIWEGLKINQILSPSSSTTSLKRFAQEFSLKFEKECIPILKALDPETGVDYGDLATEFTSTKLLDEFDTEINEENAYATIDWREPLSHILNAWVKTGVSDNQQVVKLQSDELARTYGERNSIISPSLSVFFRVCNDGKLFIENVGGPSASSVIGRFSLFDSKMADIQKEIILAEQKNNPDLVFAEILHIDDYNLANVDQRNRARDYEIPILTTSLAEQARQIQLSDICIQVVNGEVVLWSKKLKKRVIPRLSSAYNHSKSSLAIYRFLCDLQYQGMAIPTPFNMASIFPGLKFYPRLETDNIVIHLAEWIIEEKELSRRLSANHSASERDKALRIYLNETNLPEIFSFSEADRQLVFYKGMDASISLLSDILMVQKTLVLKEHPFSKNENSFVKDGSDSCYSSQFIAFLIGSTGISNNIYIRPNLDTTYNVKRRYIPGEECVYLKIYCHQSFANQLITNIIFPFVKMYAGKIGKIEKWFFVRYYDPNYHIRLRFFCEESQQIELLSSLKTYLQPLLSEGRIADISWSTYSREIERYSFEKIHTV